MSPNLHSLPLVVIDNLLDHLDFSSLKKLRLVSQHTKEWVEQPRHIQKFKIRVGMGDQTELMSSAVHWNNLLIMKTAGRSLEPFLDHHRLAVKHLEIITDSLFQQSNEIEWLLSLLGPRMETLVIPRITLELPESVYKDWMKNFKDLKTFRIDRIFHFVGTERTLFDLILNECSKLTHLTIPCLTQHDWKVNDVQYNNLVIQPVLNYLRRIDQTTERTNLMIDFKDQRTRTPEILFELVEICSRLGVQISNFPVASLPDNSRNLTNATMEMLKKTITSVYVRRHRWDDHLLQTNQYIPLTAQVNMSFTVLNDFQSFVTQGSIHILRVFCPGGTFSTMNFQNLYANLFQTHRPTVEKLICMSLNSGYNFTMRRFGRGISQTFPNLRILELHYSPCVCFHSLFRGLPLLETLKIDKCRLTDPDVLGNDENDDSDPPILHLQNLSHLELLNCENGLTDNSFTKAINRMRLTTFVWTHTRSSQVTFWIGIHSLRTLGFADSIRHFRIERPLDCSQDDVRQFININFPNIHDYSVHEPRDDSSSELEHEDVESDYEENESEDGQESPTDESEESDDGLESFLDDESDESEYGLESSTEESSEDGQIEN